MKTKTQWASKLGFIMATAGAAIGLGNLWKFPYLMGRNGGFPFLIAYLFFIVILGLPPEPQKLLRSSHEDQYLHMPAPDHAWSSAPATSP